jgi:site-specific recombinase XerD
MNDISKNLQPSIDKTTALPYINWQDGWMKTLIQSFLDYIEKRKNYSPMTVKSYSVDLHQFADFMETHFNSSSAENLKKIDNVIIRGFLAELAKNNISGKSRGRKLAALRSFFSWLIREGHLSRNPAKSISSPRAEKKLPTFLTVPEMEVLLSQPDAATPLGARDAALIEILYGTGIRSAELVGLSLGDIDLQGRFARVMGKGSKERIVPFGEPSADKIRLYLPFRRELCANSQVYPPRRPKEPNFPAFAPAFVRNPSFECRRRSPFHTGTSRPLIPFHHPEIYSDRDRTAYRNLQAGAPAGVEGQHGEP